MPNYRSPNPPSPRSSSDKSKIKTPAMNNIANGNDSPRNVLISGGARGIGRSIARNFLERGNKVFIFDIDEDELRYTAEEHLRKFGDRISYAICNLRDVGDIQEKVKQAAEWFGGRIDVLVNNGGIASPHWKDNQTMENPSVLEQWQAYVETNLTAPFACSSACIPYMKASLDGHSQEPTTAGPCVIHMGSFRALQSDPDQEGYASTKAGQLGLMQAMSVSCQRWGIRVNLVSPGRIKVAHECREGDEKGTKFEESITEDDVEQHSVNRPGRPSDIFQAVEYLVKSGFVTGQDITVDGGVVRKK